MFLAATLVKTAAGQTYMHTSQQSAFSAPPAGAKSNSGNSVESTKIQWCLGEVKLPQMPTHSHETEPRIEVKNNTCSLQSTHIWNGYSQETNITLSKQLKQVSVLSLLCRLDIQLPTLLLSAGTCSTAPAARPQLSIDISPTGHPAVVAVDRWDRQTDGQTPDR